MTVTTTTTTPLLNYSYQAPNELEIKENSRYITEFMDIKVKYIDLSHFLNERSFWMIDHNSKPVDSPYFNYPTSFSSKEDCLEAFIKCTRYHQSFDWLMTVVSKIESLIPNPNATYQQPTNKFKVVISDNICQINLEGAVGLWGSFNIYGDTKLIATYNGVVQFIKWYNQNVLKWIGVS